MNSKERDDLYTKYKDLHISVQKDRENLEGHDEESHIWQAMLNAEWELLQVKEELWASIEGPQD